MNSGSANHYVLVPGSFHGGWCFYKVLPLLKATGATAVAVELPAHGKDKTPLTEVTLDSYVDAVCREIDKYNEPVILVGHSRAGIIVSQVAERCPEKIKHAVYLAAFIIPDGEPMAATALSDAGSLLGPNLIFNEKEGWHMPKADMVAEVFYHDCSAEDVELAISLLAEEPNAPVATPLKLTTERYGRVNKVYIETLHDKTVSHQLQKKMMERSPVNKTYIMDTSHSPFFSKPRELADILLSL